MYFCAITLVVLWNREYADNGLLQYNSYLLRIKLKPLHCNFSYKSIIIVVNQYCCII